MFFCFLFLCTCVFVSTSLQRLLNFAGALFLFLKYIWIPRPPKKTSKTPTTRRNTTTPQRLRRFSNLLFQLSIPRLRDGKLRHFDPAEGKAMFISHQWASDQHPDPDGEQLKVFIEAMSHLLKGNIEAVPNAYTECINTLMRWPQFAGSALSEGRIFVWYDYFCIPQDTVTPTLRSLSQNIFQDQQNAIASIPSYISRCEFFVVCPVMQHETNGSNLSLHSWQSRGWCRTEAMIRDLSLRNSFVLFVESRRQVTVGSAWQSLFRAPGDGQFTVPSDRDLVGSMLQSMLRWKLEDLLRQGDFTAYRFLLNQQHFRLRKCNVAPVPGLVLLEPEIEDHADALVQQFLFQNGFSSICDRDKAGWSPFCYAAVNGNPELLIAMLRKRADPNDYLRKPYRAAYLDKDSSALYICSRFGNHESMRILLENRANPSKADSLGFTPLCAVAVFADNVEGARLLLKARADAFAENGFGQSAFTVAATHGAIKILKELLKTPACARTSRSGILHEAVFLCHAPVEHISVLLEIGCDINEPLHYRKMPNRLLFGFFTLRHFVKRKSAMSTLAYHHAGATPLMMSILANYYAASHLLIHAKARLDLQNSRHQTAFDLAIKTSAPDFLLQELWQHGAANYASEASRSSIWWRTNDAQVQRPLIPSEEVVSQEMQEEDDPDDPMVSIQFWLGDKIFKGIDHHWGMILRCFALDATVVKHIFKL